MRGRRRLALTLALAALAATSAVAQAPGVDRALVGTYDGAQMEIAAGLELRADGRFRYGLSYGALDEEAEGRWARTGDAVLLTGDPVTPPRFVPVADAPAPTGQLLVKLDLPEGMSGQYFRAATRLADGTVVDRQLTEEGELALEGLAAPASGITLLLPVASLDSGPLRLAGTGGHRLRYRFEPHDLGKVAFARTALRIEHGDILLQRHDRTIRFRRVSGSGPRVP